MKKLIDWEKPDLAILTGDMVSGYAWDHSEGWYEK
jgi:predicted MPP superfamily phosphohydrolase